MFWKIHAFPSKGSAAWLSNRTIHASIRGISYWPLIYFAGSAFADALAILGVLDDPSEGGQAVS